MYSLFQKGDIKNVTYLLFLSYPAALKSCIFRSCEKKRQAVAESLISHFKVPLLFRSDCPQQIIYFWILLLATEHSKFLPKSNPSFLRTALRDLQLGFSLCFLHLSLKQKHNIALSLGRGKKGIQKPKKWGGSQRRHGYVLTLHDNFIKWDPSCLERLFPYLSCRGRHVPSFSQMMMKHTCPGVSLTVSVHSFNSYRLTLFPGP